MNLIKQLNKYGWEIKTGKDQLYGSPADIYAEIDFEGHHFLKIDDGNCIGDSFLFHIYVGDLHRKRNFDGKIFEGRISTKKEFNVVMNVLGFVKV